MKRHKFILECIKDEKRDLSFFIVSDPDGIDVAACFDFQLCEVLEELGSRPF